MSWTEHVGNLDTQTSSQSTPSSQGEEERQALLSLETVTGPEELHEAV